MENMVLVFNCLTGDEYFEEYSPDLENDETLEIVAWPTEMEV